MSRIAIIGDVHGQIDLMLKKAEEVNAEVIVQVGDFGTFVSEERMDRATRKYEGLGDFHEYYSGKKMFSIPMYFVKGNHEDFEVIEEIKAGRVKNLHFLENGSATEIGGLVFGALGGNYSPTRFQLDRDNVRLLQRKKHFNHQDLENLLRVGCVDVIIAHDCPSGTGIYGGFDKKECGSTEIRELIEQIQPSFYFHGHYHKYHESMIGKTKVISLGILTGKSQSIYVIE